MYLKPLTVSLITCLAGGLLSACDSSSNPSGAVTDKCVTTNTPVPEITFPAAAVEQATDLGRWLFHDHNLSLTRQQSCATCHDPQQAFVDVRSNASCGAVSLGDDGVSLGTRNAPTLTYASLTPDFALNSTAVYAGGFFHDGRAATLQQQAGQPFLNPVEMQLPSKAAVVARVVEQDFYLASWKRVYGRTDFSDIEGVFNEITASLAAYQSDAAVFATFDSKYDRWLAGQYTFTEAEARGKDLFFGKVFFFIPSCVNCHRMGTQNEAPYELFTNHLYHNIGTPVNQLVRDLTGNNAADAGIGGQEGLTEAAKNGAFKTPTLRNVAVTGPYMHNGVLQTLEGVLEFYNFRSQPGNLGNKINPETGLAWEATDYPEAISNNELMMPALLEEHKSDLIAFLKTLTDQRYEYLLTE